MEKGLHDYKVPSSRSISNIQTVSNIFLIEFYKILYKIKPYGTIQPNDTSACRLLKSANLSNHLKELNKATMPKLQHDLSKINSRKC